MEERKNNMKIINGKELGFMPNGTVFSDIVDKSFAPSGLNYGLDATINGLHILCGHDSYFTQETGKFNGVLHMLDYVSCFNKDITEQPDWDTLTDTDSNDYTEDEYVVVYEKEEIEKIIENLQWALNGCN